MPLELRVALPGCRSCSRCSLAVPFQQRFEAVTTFQQKTYFVVLLLSAAATAFLIAPSAYHRVNFAQGDKQHIVRMANRLTLAGLFFLVLAMTGAVLLVTDVLFGTTTVAVTTAVTALTFAALWFALPLARRARR